MHYYCKALGRRMATNFPQVSVARNRVQVTRRKRPAQGVVLQGPNLMFTPLKSQNATSLHMYPLFVNLLHYPSNLSCPYCYLTVLQYMRGDLPPLPPHRDACMCRTAAWWQGLSSTMRCKIFCTCRTNCRQSNNFFHWDDM